MSASDDGDGDIGHWVKEIERQLCAAAPKRRRRRNWRRLTEEEGGTVKRAIDLDRLIGDWTADKRERAKEERDSFLPSHTAHITIKDRREKGGLFPLFPGEPCKFHAAQV